MSFAILVALIDVVIPNAFSFSHSTVNTISNVSHFSNYIYFGFVTLTTLDYGDIVPLTPTAKSFSIFIAITGQLYIAIILAAIISFLKFIEPSSGN